MGTAGVFLVGLGYIGLSSSYLAEEEAGDFSLDFRTLTTFQLNGLLFYAFNGNKVTLHFNMSSRQTTYE